MRVRIKTDASGQRRVEKANFASVGGISRGGSAAGTSQSTSYLLGSDLKSSLLEGIVDEKTPQQLQAVYRDIYMHDPVSGAAVDLKATMPWSEFTLTGADDAQLQVFQDTIDRLNMNSLHTELATEQMVTGAFVGSLSYDPKVKGLTDVIPYNYADCEVQPVPLYSTDPIIRLNVSQELKAFANLQDDEAQRIQKRIPASMLEHFKNSKQVDLDPLSTLYVPRTTLSTLQIGVSYYRRVLPIYLLERVLFRGTISEATRRQRATLHVQAGDEDWLPNEDELNVLVGLFQSSEQDPISSIVATRHNVITQEIRSGGDFWKWTDVSEQLANMKMQALGINESFLSGEASYNTMETALSVFIEGLLTYRTNTTRQIYNNRIFPLVSGLNEFYKDDSKNTRKETAYLQDVNYKLNNSGTLVIPEVNWHKQLRPEADTEYLEMLGTLTEKGLPVTLRMWAAAGGINVEKLLKDLEDDKKLRAEIEKLAGSHNVEDQETAGFMRARLAARPKNPLVSMMQRDYGAAAEPYKRTVTGKKQHVLSAVAPERAAEINRQVDRALRALSDPNQHQRAYSRRSLLQQER